MSEDIRKMIDKIKNFKQFINERYEINNISDTIVMLYKESNNGHYLLYDTISKTPIGYISFGLYPLIGSYTVGGAYSEKGYGAFLYESAMTQVYPNGLSMSRDSNTSGDALGVWDKFNKRKDVKKERIYSDEITHKKEDLPDGGSYDDNPEYLEYIFELEDTRFFYNYGKDKLNKLLDVGKKYKAKNDISDDDIEHMTWGLE